MGYWYWDYWDDRMEFRVDKGTDSKNNLKLRLMDAKKQHGATHTFCVERRKCWDCDTRSYQHYEVWVGVPTPEYLATRKAEIKAWEVAEEMREFYQKLFKQLIENDDRYLDEWGYKPYKRTEGERRPKGPGTFPGRGKPDLSEEDLLEERLSQPRARYQRGWKRIYQPTRNRRYTRSDRKNWKRHSKGCKSWAK